MMGLNLRKYLPRQINDLTEAIADEKDPQRKASYQAARQVCRETLVEVLSEDETTSEAKNEPIH